MVRREIHTHYLPDWALVSLGFGAGCQFPSPHHELAKQIHFIRRVDFCIFFFLHSVSLLLSNSSSNTKVNGWLQYFYSAILASGWFFFLVSHMQKENASKLRDCATPRAVSLSIVRRVSLYFFLAHPCTVQACAPGQMSHYPESGGVHSRVSNS